MQKKAMEITKPFIAKAISELYCKTFPQCFTMADLGCSSGPNSFSIISSIINTIHSQSQKLGSPLPEFQVFLNDLPKNDFNTLFQFIPCFEEEIIDKEGDNSPYCFIVAVPGSFYKRLFPTNSMFFMHSCYSVHWLSQVPKGIANNKRNIYMAETSPPSVLKAYSHQFEKDFSLFLQLRSKEMVSNGCMVITLIGRWSENPSTKECCRLWELLAKSLWDMVAQGLVQEEKLGSFNIPHYTPSCTELRNIIRAERSFHLDLLDTFQINWDANDDAEVDGVAFDNDKSAHHVTNCIRAVSESMIVNHFGEEIVDNLFHRYTEYVSEQLVVEKIKYVNFVICMTKKV
ncbi:hypothetical protein ACHQM5_005667 [Ranunculus cassubicifolius]